jgi:hypothetical protein
MEGPISVLSFKCPLTILFSVVLVFAPAFASGDTATTHKKTSTHSGKSHKSKSHKLHGQQAIDSSRVTQIQQALIREHYLTGEPNGSWDATTLAAMQKFQSDQGWQTRLMPDSRALKKLGLGPNYSTTINAEGSTLAAPKPPNNIPETQAAGGFIRQRTFRPHPSSAVECPTDGPSSTPSQVRTPPFR